MKKMTAKEWVKEQYDCDLPEDINLRNLNDLRDIIDAFQLLNAKGKENKEISLSDVKFIRYNYEKATSIISSVAQENIPWAYSKEDLSEALKGNNTVELTDINCYVELF